MPFNNLHHGNAEVKRETDVTSLLLKKRESNSDGNTSNLAPDLYKVVGCI